MKNKIEHLRNHLFETLEALNDKDNPMDIDRAGAIANVARVIVDSAKAEVEFMKVAGSTNGTGFITAEKIGGAPSAPDAVSSPLLSTSAGKVHGAAAAQHGAPQLVKGAPVRTPESTPLRVCDNCHQRTKMDPCEHCQQSWKRTA